MSFLPCSFSTSQSSHRFQSANVDKYIPKCPRNNRPVIFTINFELGMFATFTSLMIPLNPYNSENSEVH